MLDLVAVGTGIGWLNAWQAERAAQRTDVVVRRLVPVSLYDEFPRDLADADASAIAAAFVRSALDTCGGPAATS